MYVSPIALSHRTGAMLVLVSLLVSWLTACRQPDGTEPTAITWDRDTCEYCRMSISDRGFAAQAWVESRRRHYVFDDIGCLVNWLHDNDMSSDQVRLWVADHRHRDRVHWLDARSAWYRQGMTTPMDYGFGATGEAEEGALTFDEAYPLMLRRDGER